MFKQNGRNLLDVPPDMIKKWLESFDTVIADCDGVLWIHGLKIDGSVEAINGFRQLGKKVFFCTNNSTKTRQDLFEKSHQMGYQINENEIISTAQATASYLKKRKFNKKVFLIGSSAVAKELDAVGIEHSEIGSDHMISSISHYLSHHLNLENNIGAVVVGFDMHFSLPKIIKAASYLRDPNCLFLATNTDENFIIQNVVIPSSGTFVKAIQTCSLREPFIIGKPNPSICENLLVENEIDPARTLMIGDRGNTDILLGYNCGFQTLLVGSGVNEWKDIQSWKVSNNPEHRKLIPDLYLPKLGDIVPFFSMAN